MLKLFLAVLLQNFDDDYLDRVNDREATNIKAKVRKIQTSEEKMKIWFQKYIFKCFKQKEQTVEEKAKNTLASMFKLNSIKDGNQ